MAFTAFWPCGAEAGWLDNITNQAGQIGRELLRQREIARQEEQRRQREQERQRQRERQRQDEIRRRGPPAPPPTPARSAPPETYAHSARDESATQVRAIQRRLTELGYRPGPIDGEYGRNTREAVRAFQADHSIPPDGAITDKLLTYMSETSSESTDPIASEPPRKKVRTVTSTRAAKLNPKTSGVKTQDISVDKLSRAAASKSLFDGITIVRLATNEARFAIAGDYARSNLYHNQPSYLVIFTSSEGSYASVADHWGRPVCTAWADAIGDSTATFGVAIDSYEGRPSGHWCQPFTVSLEGDSRIRLTANNRVPAYGTKGGQTQRMSHDGSHDIVLRVHDLNTDFNLPVFAKHELYGVRIGPIVAQDGPPRIRIRHDPLLASVDIRLARSQQTLLHAGMNGKAAPSELTDWPTDYLIELHDVKRLDSTAMVPSNTFNSDLAEEYGKPTLYRNFFQNRSGGQDRGNGMWWLYDHAGRLLTAKDAKMTNCAGDVNLWRDNVTLWSTNSDLGPWGCSLVMLVNHDAGNYPSVAAKAREAHELGLKGPNDDPVFAELNMPRTPATGYSVSQVRQEIVAGNAMAYRHFLARLKALAEQRKQLGVKISAPRDVAMPRIEPHASEPAAPTVTARKIKNAQFVYEGVHLGMTADQIAAELRRHGFVANDGGRGQRFVTKGAAPFSANNATVLVSYSSNFDSEQVREIIIVFNSVSSESGQRESRRKYEEIVTDYGSPSDCLIANQCRWERYFDGWNEVLGYQNAMGSGLKISIILTASIDDREKFAKLATIDDSANLDDASPLSIPDGLPKSPIAADTFETRKPFGVAIGQTADKAKVALEAAGYQASRSWGRDCKRSAGHHTDASETNVFIRLARRKTDLRCQRPDSLVQIIEISHFERQGLSDSFDELSDKISRAFRMKPTCENRVSSVKTCQWSESAVEPLVQKVELRMKPGVVEYGVYGVDELTTVTRSSDHKTISRSDNHWWSHTQAGRGIDRLNEKLRNSEELAQFSTDDHEKVLKEATEVYSYCGEQGIFAKLHDCGCVAEKFMTTRREYWQMQEEKYGKRLPEKSAHDWLGLADERADQCPSKPGAAKFAYTECNKMYGRRLPDGNDRDKFCTCYADAFAVKYMADSRAYISNIASIGTAATQECVERGYPSPLGR